jgi:hypothetical protein
MRAPIFVIPVVALAVAALAGCHGGPRSCAARVERLKHTIERLDGDESRALAAVDQKRAAYDLRFERRETELKVFYQKKRQAIVKASAEEYHGLLQDSRATDPQAAAKMNPRIAAAADRFREAEHRAEAKVGTEERAVLQKLEAKRRLTATKLDRYRESVERDYATKRSKIEAEIAREERYLARFRKPGCPRCEAERGGSRYDGHAPRATPGERGASSARTRIQREF